MCWIRWLTIALLTLILTIGSHTGWMPPIMGKSFLPGTKELGRVGQFHLVYGNAHTPLYQKVQREFQQSGGMEQMIAGLNSLNLTLPTDIGVKFTECGEVNAFYSPNDRLIVMCYDLMIAQLSQFMQPPMNQSPQEAASSAAQVFVFVTLHEVGHALVDVLNLPITGREEDAVDQMAAVLLSSDDSGEQAVLVTAISFLVMGTQRTQAELNTFWDTHSFSLQRFVDLTCLVYGKNPGKYTYLVEKQILHRDRAVRCPKEYQQKRDSWARLLAPYLNQTPVYQSPHPQSPQAPPSPGGEQIGPLW
jgi:hypothetical protein